MRIRANILGWLSPLIGKPRGWERIVRRIVPMQRARELPERVVVRDGLQFLANPAVPIGYHVLFFGEYEPELRQLIRRFVKPGGVAVDVGANVGWHTLLMAKMAAPDGRVLSVEANPSVRERLSQNVKRNGFTNVEIVPRAMADRPQKLTFFAPAHHSFSAGDGHVVGPGDVPDRNSITVEATTLDCLIAEKNLERWDFLKIDVEGFEWPVLQGGSESIARLRPVIAFEFNVEYAGRGGGSEALFRDFFGQRGYTVFASGRTGLRDMGNDAWPDCANLVALPRQGGEG
jgi:FkbM family methyltransferase